MTIWHHSVFPRTGQGNAETLHWQKPVFLADLRKSLQGIVTVADPISLLQQETFFQTLLLTSPFCHSLLRHEFLCAALQHCLDLLVGTSQQRHVFLVPIFAL